MVLLDKYKEVNVLIQAKSNTVAVAKCRKDSWQKRNTKNNNKELAAVRMCKSISLISQLHHLNVYFI